MGAPKSLARLETPGIDAATLRQNFFIFWQISIFALKASQLIRQGPPTLWRVVPTDFRNELVYKIPSQPHLDEPVTELQDTTA